MAYSMAETIYALSSGAGKGGVAVIRLSGKEALTVFEEMTQIKNPKPRYAYFSKLMNRDGVEIDQALCLYFKGPNSFTGEDTVEFQVHGGQGVITALFKALSGFKNLRPAEAGEFSRRAVVYGKMDLTAAEGLMDLIDAQTELQRKQALTQMQGVLGSLYENWRQALVHDMAYLEAFIDFPEEDIPPEKMDVIDKGIQELIQKIEMHLKDNQKGERLRNGFQIAIVGEPNVGKSSLINLLSKRDVAIVSDIAGTTRDVVESYLDIDGFPVCLADTAGLRESLEAIEAEGIKRAVRKAESSDLILHVVDIASYPNKEPLPQELENIPVITIWNKLDIVHRKSQSGEIFMSAKTGEGFKELQTTISNFLKENFAPDSNGVITRERYRIALKDCLLALKSALVAPEIELKAEDLRLAARALGRIVGKIETDELLDVVFRDFCIGK